MISFIIPAHNEQVMLHDCLSSIHQAALRCHLDYEIIVVNDSSTDNTDAVARLYHATVIPVEYRHIAATRNAGALAAKGQVLIFVDADTQISSGLVVGALKALDQGAVGGGAGLRLHGQPRWTERTAARMICFGLRLAGIAPGCFLYCQKTAFWSVGGFDETLFAAEDAAISRSLGRRGRFVILRERALTSDRKMRTHGLRDHLKLFSRFFRRGWSMLRDREDLGLWYGDRRNP